MNQKILVLNPKTYQKLATTQARLHHPFQLRQLRWNLANGLNNNWSIWPHVVHDWSPLPQSSRAPHHSTPTCRRCTLLTRWRSCTQQRLLCHHLRTRNSMRTTRLLHHRPPSRRHLALKTYAHLDPSPLIREYLYRHRDDLVTSAPIAQSPTQHILVSQNTNNTTAPRLKEAWHGNLSAASTALRFTLRWEHSRCTFVLTHCRASAISAARRSRDRGCCRDTSALTPEKNHSLAIIVAALSQTGRICALIFKPIQTLRSTHAQGVGRRSRACPC